LDVDDRKLGLLFVDELEEPGAVACLTHDLEVRSLQ
jgi:hypothetical protein